MPTVERVRRQPRSRLLEVREVERLTPQMVRIWLRGEDLSDFASSGADDHVKLMFAVDGSDRPVLPNPEPNGPRFAEGVTPPVMRDYTPRNQIRTICGVSRSTSRTSSRRLRGW